MKAAAALVLLAAGLGIGCSFHELSSEEKAAFDKRIRKELADGRKRKARMIAENRRVLDALPRIPGSKRLNERQNPEGGDEDLVGQTPDEADFQLYASGKLAYPEYEVMTSTGWGTFREYSIPAAMTTADVHDHFVRRLAGDWRLGDWRLGESEPAAKGVYLVSFAKGRRCVWFHIGIRTGAELRGEVPPGRSYEVATDLRAEDTC